MHSHDCFIALIDPTGRKETTFCEHVVYDKQLFIETRKKFYANHRNEDERRDVVEISKKQFANKRL